MRETQVKRTPDPAVGDRKIARAHSATEVDKAIFAATSGHATDGMGSGDRMSALLGSGGGDDCCCWLAGGLAWQAEDLAAI
jgi:hypothetical protein